MAMAGCHAVLGSLFGVEELRRTKTFRFGQDVSTSGRLHCRQPIGTVSRRSRVLRSHRLRALAEQEVSFWDRFYEAWRVLLGTPTQAEATKHRFGKLLVRDRGFNSTNLSRLYNAAKGAIAEDVELEQGEDSAVTAVIDKLGELKFNFRVRRVKSVLVDEPYAENLDLDMDSIFDMSSRQDMWEENGGTSPEVKSEVVNDELSVDDKDLGNAE